MTRTAPIPVGPRCPASKDFQAEPNTTTSPLNQSPTSTSATHNPLIVPSTPPLSRREARLIRKNRLPTSTPSPPQSPSKASLNATAIPLPLLPPPTRTMPPRPLFIASIGNPAPAYTNTLHSAGHLLLDGVHAAQPYPMAAWSKSRALGNALVSEPDTTSRSIFSSSGAMDDWILWKSPTLMNVSGPTLASAWSKWKRSSEERKNAVLVVLHDEMERELGQVRVKKGGSAKGHNGLKSVMETLGAEGFVKIGVGIGRPEGRGPDEVSRYVLRKMTAREQNAIYGSGGKVMGLLRQIEEG